MTVSASDVPRRVGWVYDTCFSAHRGPVSHPERPARLDAVAAAASAFQAGLLPRPLREATDGELRRIHTSSHLERLASGCERAPAQLDADTYLAPESFSVARLATGGLIDLCSNVARGQLDCGVAAIRPPGHHAEADRAMGFCLINQVAVAASSLRAQQLAERILIIDWDVHHGNGTQHSFENDPDVLYASTHQYPYYPGTGAATEVGAGRGVGATLNVPLAAGAGDSEYTCVFERLIAPAARAFRPDFILVSTGFDPHRDDPLADMRVTEEGFRAMAGVVRGLADTLCGGKLVFALEGGYSPSGLAAGTRAVLRAALADRDDEVSWASDPPNPRILALIEEIRGIHGRRVPDLGAR